MADIQEVLAGDSPNSGRVKWNESIENLNDDKVEKNNPAFTGTFVKTPSAAQVLVAATAILANAGLVRISAASAITSTAAPTIANGTEGQVVKLLNVGSNDITLQDQGTLANSNLRLSATTITLGPRDSVELTYSSDIGDWVQTSPVVNVL